MQQTSIHEEHYGDKDRATKRHVRHRLCAESTIVALSALLLVLGPLPAKILAGITAATALALLLSTLHRATKTKLNTQDYPGWYPKPHAATEEYWDGVSWSMSRPQTAALPRDEPSPQNLSKEAR